MPPLFYFAYKLGAWLLGQELEVTQIDLSFDWSADRFGEIWQPFLLGCVVCGWVSGVTLYVLVHLVWRLEVGRRWHKRRKKRSTRSETSAVGVEAAAISRRGSRGDISSTQSEWRASAGLRVPARRAARRLTRDTTTTTT